MRYLAPMLVVIGSAAVFTVAWAEKRHDDSRREMAAKRDEKPAIPAAFQAEQPAFQMAGNADVYQLPGRKWRIGRTTSKRAAVYYGALSGNASADKWGRAEGIFEGVQLGVVNVIECDESPFDPNVPYPHMVPHPGDIQSTITLTNAPPSVAVTSCVRMNASQYAVSGVVTDDTPDSRVGLTVTLTPVAAGLPSSASGTLATVQADGTWRATVFADQAWAKPQYRVVVTDWYGLTTSTVISLP